MKKLVNRLLFGQFFFKQYPAVSIGESTIEEKVFFEIEELQYNISQKHWLLSLEPMVFGIWFDNKMPNIDKKTACKLHFNAKGNKTIAVLELKLKDTISENSGSLFLFEVSSSKILYLSSLKTYLIYMLYYKKPSLSFSQFKNLAAAFSYPRKVWLVSFKKEGYFNIFPMDLAGNVPEKDWFVFGLRHTNSTLDRIINERKIVASEFPSLLKDGIYKLAHHHSSNPPNLDSLPFKVKNTRKFDFPIPETIIKYHEIEIIKTLNLGSHMMLFGKVINTVSVNEKENNLFHIHFLNYLNNSPYNLA